MDMKLKADLCVIGAGSGGLSTAVAAAQMGASTILVERSKMGGDCLNYGCIPSKSLLAAGKLAFSTQSFKKFGLKINPPMVDHKAVYDHVHKVIATLAPHDSVRRMESLGINVIKGTAEFISRRELRVGNKIIRARRYVIATGSSPAIPPIPGLNKVHYFTNETIFDAKRLLPHLVIIGGGPIGIEMAQAHKRLGSEVTLLQRSHILPRDDDEAVEILRQSLKEEEINIHEEANIRQVASRDGSTIVTFESHGKVHNIKASHLLVAAGRRACVYALKLENAGVTYSSKGIKVNKRMCTTNRRIYAVGDVVGQHQFTHMSSYHAGIVIKNILFRLRAKVSFKAVPWVTYTEPELAQVGLTEKEAQQHHLKVKLLRWDFAENDRAQAEHTTKGLIKVVTNNWGKVLGATIIGPHAGELLLPWIMAVSKGMRVGDIANLIVPYPTLSEVSKKAASNFFTPMLFSNRTRRLVRFLFHFR